MTNQLQTEIINYIVYLAIFIASYFSGGVLKKAGEDFYNFIKIKITQKEIKPATQILIEKTLLTDKTTEKTYNTPTTHSTNKISNITFKEISDTIENTLPLQQESIKNSFVGLHIEWVTYLKSGSPKKDGGVNLLLTTDNIIYSNTIWCEVPLSEYKELQIKKRGTKIKVSGEIIKASRWDIELKNAKLQFLEDD